MVSDAKDVIVDDNNGICIGEDVICATDNVICDTDYVTSRPSNTSWFQQV